MNLCVLKYERAKAEASRAHDLSDIGIRANENAPSMPTTDQDKITPQNERKAAKTTLQEFIDGKPLEYYGLGALKNTAITATIEQFGKMFPRTVVAFRKAGSPHVHDRQYLTQEEDAAYFYNMLKTPNK